MVRSQGSRGKRVKKEPFSLEELSKVYEIRSFDIAPNGKELVFSWNKSGNFDIYTMSAEGGKAKSITSGEGNKIMPLYSFDGRWVSFLQDFQGNENYDMYLMRPDGSDMRAIIEDRHHCIRSPAWSHDSQKIAFEANFKGAFDLYVTTVEERCPHRIHGPVLFPILKFTPDDKYLVFSSMDVKNLRSEKIYISDLETGETRVLVSTGENAKDGGFIGGGFDISSDGKWIAFASDVHGQNHIGLYSMVTGEITWIYTGKWEAKEPRFSVDSEKVAYVLNSNGTMDIYVYDLKSEESVPLNMPTGTCSPPKFSRTGDFLVVIRSGPKSPPDLWMYELQERTWIRLTNSLKGNIDLSLLADPMELWWISFDGRKIPGLFYPTSNYAGPGKPPCIVWPHGGPTGQSVNRWNPYLQYMVAQGYSVLAPNVRGSTGYGAEFRDLNLKDWGGGDLKDLVAGVDYIVKQDLVDGSKICIMGISYGGYLTLMAMAKFPKKWAAGCSICGVVNLMTLWETTRGDLREYLMMQLGKPEENPELYYDRSPINFVSQIEAPLQIQQGANDPRVPRAEAEQIVSALRSMGKECEYVLYEDEGHVFLKTKNKIDSIKRAVRFFNRLVRDR